MAPTYRVIRPFDPWRAGSLCTCPQKYTVNPFTGCGHRCTYCYITSYVRDAFNPRPKERLLKRALRDIRSIPKGAIINLSSSSDPYPPREERLGLTRSLLSILIKTFKLEVVTKSPLVVRDANILSKGSAAVSVTITTLDEEISKRLEPSAPRPSDRLKALKILSGKGIPTILRLDPILLGLNDTEKSVRSLIEQASRVGVRHVVSSLYKAKPDSMLRVLARFPELRDKYRELYVEKGERIHGAYYLPSRIRLDVLKMVREIAHECGLTFATCREGLSRLNDRNVKCDGSHLLPEK